MSQSDSSLERRPDRLDFCVVGAQKCGTSSIFTHLSHSPRVVASTPKEPHFFIEDRSPTEVRTFLESVFPPVVDGAVVGEGSTSYSMFPVYRGVPERLARHNEALKVIYAVRDPVARIESSLAHSWLARRLERIDLTAALETPVYVNRSRYWLQVSKYLEHFPADQIRVVVFEDYLRNPSAVMAGLWDFLEVPPSPDPAQQPWRNPTENRPGASSLERRLPPWAVRRLPTRVRRALRARSGRTLDASPRLPAADAEVLRDLLRSDVEALGEYLGRDLVSLWSPRAELA